MLDGYTGDLTEKQKNMLRRSSIRLKELLNLIDDILYFRIVPEQITKSKKNVILKDIIDNVKKEVQIFAQERDIKIKTFYSEERLEIRGNAVHLQKALTNILINAIIYSNQGGEVSIKVQPVADNIKESVVISVIDEGIGIEGEDLPHIFEEFYRGKNVEVKGAGLGLAVVKKIVNAHQGEIFVESEGENKGSNFKLILPKTKGEENGEKKILMINDDEDFLEGTKIALEANNLEVETCTSGEEGLKKLEKEVPNLILLDIMMPKKSGFEVCKELKKNVEFNKIPVIMLTALSEKLGETTHSVSEGLELEADDYIDKPVDIKTLVERINHLLK